MKIYLKKFGTMLISRPSGKEALAAFSPILKDVGAEEVVEVDFEGVFVFTPSWGSEFLDPLLDRFGERLFLKNTENSSVKATIEFLEETYHKKFRSARNCSKSW
jgi:hypothetical protein